MSSPILCENAGKKIAGVTRRIPNIGVKSANPDSYDTYMCFESNVLITYPIR